MGHMIRFPSLLLVCMVLISYHMRDAAGASADKNENQVGTYNKLGLERLKENKLDQAVQYFDKAIALKPDDASAWNNKGYALNKMQKSGALECYQKAVKLDPGYAEAWLNMAYFYMQFGSYREEFFNKAIKLKPDFAEAWLGKGTGILMVIENSGWAWSRDQKEREQARNSANDAIGCFEKAIKIRPDHAGAWLSKADCYFLIAETKIGRREIRTYYEDAIKFYSKAGELQPDMLNDHILENMGISHDNVGQYDKAMKCFNRVKQGRNLAYNKGITYTHLGKYREAIECFDKILEQRGEMHEQVKVLKDKGNALKALGRADEAQKCFDEAGKIEKSLR